MELVQQVADRQALTELVALYCRAVDRRDFALLEQLYHPEAVHDHGGLFRGSREEFLAFLARSMGDVVTHHFVGNALFALDGDRAEGEVYTINYHVIGTDERRDYVAGGRYLDQYQRHAGRWVFMKRQRLVDWAHEGPTADAGVAAALSRGVAGPADPSFAVLPGLARLRQGSGSGG